MKNAKDQYRELFEKVREVINKYDPEGLDPGKEDGTPIDEYDAEAAAIVAFVIHNLEEIKLNRTLLVNKVNQIWKEYFGEFCELADAIARDIIHQCS